MMVELPGLKVLTPPTHKGWLVLHENPGCARHEMREHGRRLKKSIGERVEKARQRREIDLYLGRVCPAPSDMRLRLCLRGCVRRAQPERAGARGN